MARGSNPFYYRGDEQLGAALGQSLGTALFGDPEMRSKLALQEAQMANYGAQVEEARAHAGLYGEQTRGLTTQNNAALSLPDLVKALFLPAAPAAPAAAPAAVPDPTKGEAYYPEQPAAPAAAPAFDEATFKLGLPALVAAMGQMQGDKIDPNAIYGGLAAMFGGDELARRGMVAQGKTPTEDFALTPQRADAISARDAAESKDQAVSVERIQSGDRRYSTDVGSKDRRYAVDVGSKDRRYSTDVASADRHDALDTKGYDRAGAIALGNTLGKVTSTVRTPEHNKEVGGVSNSFHLASRGGRAVDIARRPGVSHADVVASYKRAGYTILEQLDEGDHSHLALAGGPNVTPAKGSGGRSGGKGKTVSAADHKMIKTEIDEQIAARGWAQTPDAGTLARIREAALTRFQQGGNPAEAVSATLDEVKRRFDAKQGGKKDAPKKTAAAPAGKPSTDDLRRQALAAIGKGADPAAVRARFKKMTGQELKGS